MRVKDGKTKVLNGPYAESKEQLAGYYMIEAKDLDAALSLGGEMPGGASRGDGSAPRLAHVRDACRHR